MADSVLNTADIVAAGGAPSASPTFTGTVAGVTKAHVGLGNVDNTSDLNKPISTAETAALALKAPLASPAFTGTPTGITATHVGLGNVSNTSDANKPVSTAQQTALNLKANIAAPTFTGLVTTAGQVQFPATQSASTDANCLDDYEEGPWTPNLSFNGGVSGLTFTKQVGRYVKVGGIVTLWCDMTLSTKGASGGNAIMTAPFTAKAITNMIYSGFVGPHNLTGFYSVQINQNATQLQIMKGAAQATDSDFADGSILRFCLQYEAN